MYVEINYQFMNYGIKVNKEGEVDIYSQYRIKS